MEIFWISDIVIALFELIALLILVILYAISYRKYRAKIYVQIISFTSIFTVQSALTIYIYYYFSRFLGATVAIPLMALSILGIAAIAMLFRFMRQ
ncbi:MAG: hypothetical protein RE471_05320 [Ferroplasma sp.]|uniref:hypothetical protein n=1 Tax=Ferroplasma sp. TaxID=2591003 RepID=UPI00281601C0|nr:hypothetical protein [Ferroplasma sp.]WMT50405.1 MAG: hypothetical protein RE471_05320 [Ferroplasma sp.]